MSYKENYVAFIDILGFSNLVAESVSDQSTFNKIVEIFENLDSSIRKINKGLGSLLPINAVYFSDSIIMSTNCDSMHLHRLLLNIETTALDFLKSGILIRGAIAHGKNYHTDTAAFGPAIIKAYRAEQALAKYPRIILDPDTYSAMQILAQTDVVIRETIFPSFLSDGLGTIYFDALKKLKNRLNSDETDYRELGIAYCAAIAESITKRIPGILKNPSYFEKYIWFVTRFNDMVEPLLETHQGLSRIDLFSFPNGGAEIRNDGYLA